MLTKNLSQRGPRSKQPALHRSRRNPENLRNLLILQSPCIPQQQNGPVFVRKTQKRGRQPLPGFGVLDAVGAGLFPAEIPGWRSSCIYRGFLVSRFA